MSRRHSCLVLFLLSLPLLLALKPARPATLNIATDCGATPNDATDDTLAIQDCLARAPRELVIPVGTFLVAQTSRNQAAAVLVSVSDTTVRGEGVGSVVRLIRGEKNFSRERIFGAVPASGQMLERVTFRDFTIDGARDESTCLEAKHTSHEKRDGRGQQQHGVIIGAGCGGRDGDEGCTSYVRNVVIERINFKGLSGDAIYLYNNVEDISIRNQIITGWCRAGIAMNAYEDCDQHVSAGAWDKMETVRRSKRPDHVVRPFTSKLPKRGMRNITLDGNIMIADATATQGARGIDIEPNAFVCDVTIANNRVDEMEVGGVRRLVVEGNTVMRTGAQLGGPMALVRISGASVRNNFVRSEDVSTPSLYFRVMEDVRVEANDVLSPFDVEGIQVTNNGDNFSRDVTVTRNVVAYSGATQSTHAGLLMKGIDGKVNVTANHVTGYRGALLLSGGDDIVIAENVWNVRGVGAQIQAVSGRRVVGSVRVQGNRGTADIAYWVMGTIAGEMRDCGGSTTGRRLPKENPLTSCSPSEKKPAVGGQSRRRRRRSRSE